MAKSDKKIERRYRNGEVRACDPKDDKDECRAVEGYAAVFNSESEDLGFREIIMPGAFDGVIEKSDVFALLNHDRSRGVLARSKQGKGSLTLSVDEHGLKYNFDSPDTSLGKELIENLKRGDVDGSSFSFTVAEETWENRGSDTKPDWLRKICKIDRLFDVSPVYEPAYAETSVDCRGLDKAKAELSEELRKKMEAKEIAEKLRMIG
jgi:HK97 family phage prohead protease